MNYQSDLYKDRKWYLAYEILCIEAEDTSTPEIITVWENLILIKANDPEEAFSKAMQHGFDSEDEIEVDGRRGRLKFKGLKNLVLIYDELEDGAEIEWREYEVKKDELTNLMKAKQDMHAFNPKQIDDELQ
ncbi:MAG: DUF4288 domain-containing protein [Acidobacteriota bacterium]|nr:DUF4288 domain-containing protein [Acidobacteriota bacterium]